MRPVQGEVLRDEIAFPEAVMLLRSHGSEVVVDGAEDQPQAVATLRACSVVDHVLGDEVVEDGVVAGLLPSEQFLDDVLRTPFAHTREHRAVGHPR